MKTGANALTDSVGAHGPVVDLRYTSPLVQVGHAREATGPDFSFRMPGRGRNVHRYTSCVPPITPAAMQAR